MLGNAYFFLGRHEDALRIAEGLRQRNPTGHPILRLGAISAAFAGQMDVAREYASRLKLLDPAFRVTRLEHYNGPYRSAEFREKYRQGLLKAGVPE